MGDKCTETAAKIKAKAENQNQRPRLAMTEAVIKSKWKMLVEKKIETNNK